MVIPKSAIEVIRQKMQRKKRKNDTKLQPNSELQPESQQYNELTDCPVPYISCVCKGMPLPTKLHGDDAGVRMRCTNNRCHLIKLLLHEKCFKQLEETLLKILSNLGSARGWTDAQLRSNLWEKKGLTLINKLIRCHCGQGLMSRDVDYYKKHELELLKDIQQQADAKQRKKKNPKKLPSLNFNSSGPVAAELLQNDYVGISRRASHGYTSNTSSSLLFGHGQTISDSESDSVYELRRSAAPTPTKSKLIVERPKPISISVDRPNPKQLKQMMPLQAQPKPLLIAPSQLIVQTPKPLISTTKTQSLLKYRKEQATKLPSKPCEAKNCCVAGKEKQQREREMLLKKDETTLKKVNGTQPIATQQQQKETIKKAGENPPPPDGSEEKSGRCYTLFDCTCGFFLGELLLAEAHLPRLLVPPSA